MDYVALKAELLAGHPVTGPYSANAATAAGQLNAVNIATERATLTGAQIFECVASTEYGPLSANDKQMLQTITALGENITMATGSRTRTSLMGMFGAGSLTRANLIAAVNYNTTRAEQVVGTTVSVGDVERARL